MASHKSWLGGNYHVQPLHPTLELLKWDYSSLDEDQERDYTQAKMKMMDFATVDYTEVHEYSELISICTLPKK